MAKLCFTAILLFGTLLTARDKTDWNNLRDLSAGQKIEVVKKDGQTIKGTFTAFSNDAITLESASVPRADVSRVRRGGHRTRNTLIGAGIGAAGGAAAGAAFAKQLENESGGDFAGIEAAVVGGCAGAGALIGALFGSAFGGRHPEIYRSN